MDSHRRLKHLFQWSVLVDLPAQRTARKCLIRGTYLVVFLIEGLIYCNLRDLNICGAFGLRGLIWGTFKLFEGCEWNICGGFNFQFWGVRLQFEGLKRPSHTFSIGRLLGEMNDWCKVNSLFSYLNHFSPGWTKTVNWRSSENQKRIKIASLGQIICFSDFILNPMIIKKPFEPKQIIAIWDLSKSCRIVKAP